jgi:nicotinate-nucleotide adenylyltransferase
MVTSAHESKAVGILGGSFDPIHHGHLRLAEESIQRLQLSRVLLIPARPWQRETAASAEQRFTMVELACRGQKQLVPERLEIDRLEPSYTVDTLRRLRQRMGAQTPLWLIVGADAFLRLTSWHNWTALEELCHLAVVPRPGVHIEQSLPALLQAWWNRRDQHTNLASGSLVLLDAPQLEISATAIRKQIEEGRNPRYLLPDQVLDYIDYVGLYRKKEGHGP